MVLAAAHSGRSREAVGPCSLAAWRMTLLGGWGGFDVLDSSQFGERDVTADQVTGLALE